MHNIAFRRIGLRTVPINETWLLHDNLTTAKNEQIKDNIYSQFSHEKQIQVITKSNLKIRKADPVACDISTGYVYEFTEEAAQILRCAQEKPFSIMFDDEDQKKAILNLWIADLIDIKLNQQKEVITKSIAPTYLNDFDFELKPLSAPYRVYWDITDLCNLRCKHCYVDSSIKRDDELTHEQVFEVIKQLSQASVFHATFAGGEPFMRKDFSSILQECHNSGIVTSILTNGTVLTPKNISLMEETQVGGVQISLDGANAETHDSFRGQVGVFVKVIEGIKRLKKELPKVSVFTCSTATKLNLDQIIDIMLLSHSIGCDGFNVLEFMCIGRGKSERNIIISSSEYKKLYTKLLNEYKKINDPNFKLFFHSSVPGALLVENEDKRDIHKLNRFHCCAGKESCNINIRGEVSACSVLMEEEFIAGNVKASPFSKIWKESSAFDDWRSVPKLKGKCANCSDINRCLGSCRALAYGLTDDLFSEYPSCWK